MLFLFPLQSLEIFRSTFNNPTLISPFNSVQFEFPVILLLFLEVSGSFKPTEEEKLEFSPQFSIFLAVAQALQWN